MTHNEKAIAVLEKVLQPFALWDGSPLNGRKRPSPFLCCSIDAVVKKMGPDFIPVAIELKQQVLNHLKGHQTVKSMYDAEGFEKTDAEIQTIRYQIGNQLLDFYRTAA